MLERIKMFEQKNNSKPSNNANPRNSKNYIQTPVKNLIKKDFPKTAKNNEINTKGNENIYIDIKNTNEQELITDYHNEKEIHINKFIDTSEGCFSNSNSYARQSIKRKSFLKNNNKNNINISSIFSINSKKNKNKSTEKNENIYALFVKNLKLGLKANNEIDKNEKNKRNKPKKKKMILGNFLNQFINKPQNPELNKNTINSKESTLINPEKKPNQFLVCKLIHMNIYIEGKNQNIITQNNNEEKNEIIKYKEDLEIKENKIKELSEIMEKQNIILKENSKLKEEIERLKNLLNHLDNNNNNKVIEITNQKNIQNSINIDNNKYNNLITYNINKNNNYNIINSQINNLDDLNLNKTPKKEPVVPVEPTINNSQPIKKEIDKEKEKEINNKEAEKAKKVSRAFERFKRANKSIDLSNNDKGNMLKSDKISIIAKMLEGHLGNEQNKNRDKSVEVIHKDNNNEEIVNLINNQPVVNKKKKKMQSFSFDG